VLGTHGVSDAHAATRACDLTSTVDSFPVLTGEIAIKVALRVAAGQKMPRVVAMPPALITKDNVETYATTEKALCMRP
jgi:ribose transport system substrate-binding protein